MSQSNLSSSRPRAGRFSWLTRFRLTLVSRLSLGFGMVGLGVIGILVASLFSLQQSSQGLDALVSEALPVKQTIASARLTLKDISTSAAEHYNARVAGESADIRSRVETDINSFNEIIARLENDFPLLNQVPAIKAGLAESVEQAREQFELLIRNMNSHERSIDAEARITEVRAEINELKTRAEPVFQRNLDAMEQVDAIALAYRLQGLFNNASLLAINASLADSLEVIETVQADLRDSLDGVARLTFPILDQKRADPAFADYYDDMDPLFDQLERLTTANDGLIAQQKNLFVEIRSVLPARVDAVQSALAEAGRGLQAVSQQVDDAVVGISDQALEQVGLGRTIMITATALILALCLLVSWLVVRSVRRPIRRLRDYMKQVGNGDFSGEVGHYAKDEIGEIFQSTEQLVHNIRDMIARIAELNKDINTISTDSAKATDSVRTRLNNQSQDLRSVATAVTQMSASVREVAQNTREAAAEVKQSETQAHDIETAVNAAVTSTGELGRTMQSATEVIQMLDKEVVGIEQILDVIRNIAEQTNLLALNAAIEAARAGEQGRGFAVVADEVRTLASRTQSSTEEIRQKIDSVMAGSRNAVESIATSVRNADDISGRVGHVHEAFKEYLTYVERISEINNEVSVTTGEQESVSEQITERIHTTSDSSAAVATDFELTSQRVAELDEIANNLDQEIKRFQL
ncbi:HAMP domain-containing methyl-accepting chemotaxis protein [Marinobacter confluentis]|uniref:Methyl-accepting chemotaxis protein n=1 Tax=Marinobacter confluentis TaxID=1697557 RepID=A0A4Z1BRC4_9GAMM|nr:methyl-accepting chemotaxis protein [Marinobacter confluentis]TGN40155.1 methyl-accepting chemotaxis protein [Marinobacter confluentis]